MTCDTMVQLPQKTHQMDQSIPPIPSPRPHRINNRTCDKNEYDSVFKMDVCRFDGGDCCERNLIGNGVCDEVNNFESCWNFDGGDCIMIKGPAIYGKVTAKPSTITEESVSQSILNQIAQKSSMDIEMYEGKDYQNLKITF